MAENLDVLDTAPAEHAWDKVRSSGRDPVLLLTATVDVRGVAFMARTDPTLRLEDYKQALKLWLSNPHTPPIVFCENSGYDLAELVRICEAHNPHGKPVEFISFDDNDYERTLGKGYGELRTITHALGHAETIGPQARLIKITGRLYVSNIRTLVEGICNRPEVEVFCDFRCNLTWADSRVFCASRRFFEQFMIPKQEELNDTAGVTYEHVLGRSAHHCMMEGLQWSLMPCTPNLLGMSGTDDKPYSSSMFSLAKRELFRRMKSAMLAR